MIESKALKKIVYVMHEDGPGGGPAVLQRHIRYFNKKYNQTLIIGGFGQLSRFCQSEEIKLVKLPIDRIWKCFWGWIPLYFQLINLKPDIFIVHGQWGGALGALLGKLAGVKKMLYIAQWPSFYTDWDLRRVIRNHILESVPVHFCDKVICISPGNLYQYQIRFPGCLGKLMHIPNPYDIHALPAEKEAIEIRERFGWDKEFIHVVSVGRIATQKHIEWLLHSWVIVQREVPEARLWIVGDGEESEHMQALAKKLVITDTCVFLGAQPKGINFINASDIVAMTTLYEGHANIPMEAHACGKPIVANGVDGVRETITDGLDGFLVPAGDVQGFAEKLIHLCRSEELRNQLGEAGLKNLQQFSVEKVMAKYSAVIERIIAS